MMFQTYLMLTRSPNSASSRSPTMLSPREKPVVAGPYPPMRIWIGLLIRLSLAADRNYRLVGPLAVDVPEVLEVRPVEIGELLAGIGECGREWLRLHRLADRSA